MSQTDATSGRNKDKQISDAAKRLFCLLNEEADGQSPEIQYKLGVCHEYGIGTERSMWNAVKWYRAAGAGGFCNGLQKLEHFAKHGFCMWASETGKTDWDLVYAKLMEEKTDEGKIEFQVAPTSYI